MPKAPRFSLARALVVIGLIALVGGWWSYHRRMDQRVKALEEEKQEIIRKYAGTTGSPSSESMLSEPITIAMSNVGRFARGESWSVSINSAGQGVLSIGFSSPNSERAFSVSKEQMLELRQALIAEQFFTLHRTHGARVSDGSTQSMTITVGETTKSVDLLFLMSLANSPTDEIREPARALKVYMVIRGWFNHPDAVDLRPYHQRVLNAAAAYETQKGNAGPVP